MSTPLVETGAAELIPPGDGAASSLAAGTATSTTTTAANLDLGITQGACYVSIQARGGDVYVRFKVAATAAATTTGDDSNGLKIPDGQTAHFWVDKRGRYCDHKCSAAAKYLFWWKSSPNYAART